jgi:hypothetical protein
MELNREEVPLSYLFNMSVPSLPLSEAVATYQKVVKECRSSGCGCPNCFHIDAARDAIASVVLFEFGVVPGWYRVKFSEEEPAPKITPTRPQRPKLPTRFVYLMRNRRNGFVKIGLSANPSYREGTLQAEEPEVELLFSYPGNQEIEEGLHLMFSNKRLRGEWFALSKADILEIKEALSVWSSKL